MAKPSSELCKPLAAVLTDKSPVSMLDYFIQFMELEKALHLLQFWISVEAFKSTTSPALNPPTLCNGNIPGTADHMTVTCPDEQDHVTITCPDDPNNVAMAIKGFSKQGSVSTDAIEIYSTYIALNALHPVGVAPEVRQEIEVAICPEDGLTDRSCFKEAQDFVYSLLESRYYPMFLRSASLCRYQLEYISSGQLCLLDFLLADNALFYFMEFMELEGQSSLLQFWLTADNFQRHLSSPQHHPDLEADTSDAIAIYDRFFSLQASHPLGMADNIRMDIENKICSQEGPRADSFIEAQDIIYQTINQVHFPNFLRSSIYLRFLNELVHMLNASPNEVTKPHVETQSSTAVLEWKQELDNPVPLWERHHLPMRLGYVDQFGRYISEADCPLKDSSSKSVRQIWNLRKKQQEEELTMKIAINIVSEVLEFVRTASSISNTYS